MKAVQIVYVASLAGILLNTRIKLIDAASSSDFSPGDWFSQLKSSSLSSSSGGSFFSKKSNRTTPSEDGAYRHAFACGDGDADGKSKSRNSLLRVDTRQLVHLLCKHGGVVLSPSLERDLKVMSSVCQCDEASLDLINRKLVVRNFTVVHPVPVVQRHSKNHEVKSTSKINIDEHRGDTAVPEPALKIGKIVVRWDSYLKPCVDVDVEDVDVLIEFINLILSKNNWNELDDTGFPPKMYDMVKSSSGYVRTSAASSFIRIGSISTTGEVRLHIKSRPLEKDLIPPVTFNMDIAKIINQEIQIASNRAQSDSLDGRRGCTTEEVYQIIQSCFGQQAQDILKSVAGDLTMAAFKGSSRTVTDAKRVWLEVKDVAAKYAKDVGDKTGQELDRRFEKAGIGQHDLHLFAKDLLKTTADNFLSDLAGRNEKNF
eukprot:884779_1